MNGVVIFVATVVIAIAAIVIARRRSHGNGG
jgi:hypothetical protein